MHKCTHASSSTHNEDIIIFCKINAIGLKATQPTRQEQFHGEKKESEGVQIKWNHLISHCSGGCRSLSAYVQYFKL